MIKTMTFPVDDTLSARKNRLTQAFGPKVVTWNAIVQKGLHAFEAELALQSCETASQECKPAIQEAAQ